MRESTAGHRQNPPDTLVGPPDPWRFMRWAFERETGSVARKAVLSSLAMMADAESGRCEARQATIARGVELSERAVRGHLAALEQAGLIARRPQFRRDGRRRGDEYLLLAPWIAEWPDGEPALPPADSSGGQIDHRKQGSGYNRKHSSGHDRKQGSGLELPLKNDHPKNESNDHQQEEGWRDVPEEMIRDARQLLKARHKVDGRVVSEKEMWTAAAALAEFNRQADSDFGLGANLRCVVMRVRERPSWDPSKHVRLVQSAWRQKWWTKRSGGGRRATPAVIYGNTRVFEMVAQDARDEAAGRPVEMISNGNGVGPLKSARYSDGRSWDELTPREQAVARERFAMTGRAGVIARDAAPIVPSGKVITAASLAAELRAEAEAASPVAGG